MATYVAPHQNADISSHCVHQPSPRRLARIVARMARDDPE
jgi:hypothetical protein